MSKGTSRWFDDWEAKAGPLGVAGITYALAVGSNLVSGYLAPNAPPFRPTWWQAAIIVIPPLLVAGLALTGHLKRLWPSRGRPRYSIRYPSPTYKGLVAFGGIGPGIESVRASVEHHRPNRLWLFCSDKSRSNAEALREKMAADGVLAADGVELVEMRTKDFESPEAVRNRIEERVYGDLPAGILERDVMIDFTGGTKATTTGAFLAGLPEGRHLGYVTAKAKDDEGRAVAAGLPVEINISYSLQRANP